MEKQAGCVFSLNSGFTPSSSRKQLPGGELLATVQQNQTADLLNAMDFEVEENTQIVGNTGM